MSLYKRLPIIDIDRFNSYVLNYAPSADATIYGGLRDTEHVLRFWDANKSEYLYRLLGNKFIIEKEVEIEQSYTMLYKEIANAMNYCFEMTDFYNKLKAKAADEFGMFTDPYYDILRLTNYDHLVQNKILMYTEPVELQFSNGKVLKYENGIKTMKILGKVAKIFNLEPEFEKFRLKHSLLLNQKKLKGTLCLSIHPMDYLTMSDNENGWTSCMTWQEDGDYRMGTVEMMNSKCVIVAYLKSKDRVVKWDNYEWNSKMWRTLIIADPRTIISVKSYPYESENLTKQCIEWVRTLGQENLGWNFPYDCEVVPEGSNFCYHDRMVRITCDCGAMYNDFGCMTHYGTVADDVEGRVDIYYSGEAECMFCGESNPHCLFEEHRFVLCNECSSGDENYYHCCQCDERIHEDDVYWVDDTPLCPSCFEDLGIICDLTGEYIYQEDSRRVYLAREDNNPNSDYDYYINVAQRFAEEDAHYASHLWLSLYFKRAPRYDEEEGIYYWNIGDATESGLHHYFNLCDESAVERYRAYHKNN